MSPVTRVKSDSATYLIGGGIAALAAAAFLIRDGDMRAPTITILEEPSRIGGSLDTAGNPVDGYAMRPGRALRRVSSGLQLSSGTCVNGR
jgi:oleate hydratase